METFWRNYWAVDGRMEWYLLKGFVAGLALLFAVGAANVPVLAQTAGAAAPATDAARSRSRGNIDEQVERLTKALDLSQTQQSSVKSILEQRLQRLGQIRHDPALSGTAKIDRFRALQERTVEQIRAVLNDEQKKKYDPLAARKVQPAPEQRSVDDWMKATTPH